MAEKYTQEELNQAYFIQLVYTFQAAAMQQMGKIINPLTGKVEKSMEQAKHSIDILAMLEAKTKGNLNQREQKLLEQVLFELRMNYVDEIQVEEQKKEPEEEEKEDQKEQQEEKRDTAGENQQSAQKPQKAESKPTHKKPPSSKKQRKAE